MKQKFRKLVCKVFGHRVYTEKFAVRCNWLWVHHGFTPRYDIVERTVCERCGHVVSYKVLVEGISRAQMLKEGWFIEEK